MTGTDQGPETDGAAEEHIDQRAAVITQMLV